MNDTALLDEVEEYLDTGTIKGVPFSEHGLRERIRDFRTKEEKATGLHIDPKVYEPKLEKIRMNGLAVIPDMTDPLGRHWDQPDRRMIFFVGHGKERRAHLGQTEFDQLRSYDTSYPSGVYEGKMWKRTNGKTTWLCWYDKSNKPNSCSIMYAEIVVTGG